MKKLIGIVCRYCNGTGDFLGEPCKHCLSCLGEEDLYHEKGVMFIKRNQLRKSDRQI